MSCIGCVLALLKGRTVDGSATHVLARNSRWIKYVTKRRNSWACRGNPNPEQETIKGTHTQETPAYQRRWIKYGPQPPRDGCEGSIRLWQHRQFGCYKEPPLVILCIICAGHETYGQRRSISLLSPMHRFILTLFPHLLLLGHLQHWYCLAQLAVLETRCQSQPHHPPPCLPPPSCQAALQAPSWHIL